MNNTSLKTSKSDQKRDFYNSRSQTFFEPYLKGQSCVFTTFDTTDFDIDRQGRIRRLDDIMRDEARTQFDMVMLSYSLATGVYFDRDGLSNNETGSVEQILRQHGLTPQVTAASNKDNDFIQVIRGIFALSKSRNMPLWDNGKPMKVLFQLSFAEHLIPNVQNGFQNDNQIVAAELCFKLANSNDLRNSGNYIIFNGRELVDDLLLNTIPRVHLKYPELNEKLQFIVKLLRLYSDASFERGLDPLIAANLSANTPNKSIESVIRASHKTKRSITAKKISSQREEDIANMSNETLSALNKDRVKGVELVGSNINIPRQIIERAALLLKTGKECNPNYILFGAPGYGKTDLAIYATAVSGLPGYTVHSPKDGIVGSTEKNVKLQHEILLSHKNIAFCDEFSEMMPANRGDNNLDGGASAAVTAGMLTFLSDKSRNGQNLFVATSNCPWRIGEALLGRFIAIPVLRALPSDYPAIIVAIAKSIDQRFSIKPDDDEIIKAADTFYQKGASPRTIRIAINTEVEYSNATITSSLVIAAAENCLIQHDHMAGIYADLWALKVTKSKRFLPWHNNTEYEFPDYLRAIIDSGGDIDYRKLDEKIEKLKPYVNI